MYNWFSTRLDEMIAVSGYCYYQSLNAQLQVAKASLDQIYDVPIDRMANTARAISMLIDEAQAMQNTALVGFLEQARDEIDPDHLHQSTILEFQSERHQFHETT